MSFGITPAAIAIAAADELPRIFGDALETLRQGEGEYLKSGMPESVPGKISQAAGRSACRVYNTGTTGVSGETALKYERICRPYLDDIYPPDGPSIKNQFPGGQCSILYTVRYSANDIATNGVLIEPPTIRQRFLNGPLSNFRGEGLPAFQSIVMTTRDDPAEALVVGNCAQGCFANPTIISIIPTFGEPDNCGNPPPIVTDPTGQPDNEPGPFPFNPDPFIDIDIDVDVDADGRITVNVGTGPITVDPFPPTGGGGGDGPAGPGPGDIGDAGGASDTGSGGEAEGEAGAGEVLVGIKVDILASPPRARQYAPGVFRGAGYFYMGVVGNLDQDYGGAMLKSGQFFFSEKDNLTHWQVSANNGYNFRVTPYYREA